MQRVLFAAMLLIAAGCQSQNPYAAIGPATVPAPMTGQTLPYYPPTVTGGSPTSINAAPAASAAPAKPARISVSAENTPSAAASRSAIVADPADRESIRIVENSAPAARTANAATRGTPTSGTPAAPAPSGTLTPPPNRVPTGQPSGYAPPASSPATNRMRGFSAASSQANEGRTVAPASYQQMAPTFSEATPADGQWRAR